MFAMAQLKSNSLSDVCVVASLMRNPFLLPNYGMIVRRKIRLSYPLTATHIVAGLKHIIQRTTPARGEVVEAAPLF
jgi:hypothetical protein